VPIIPALDGFRAYAILGVVVLHVLGFSGALAATDGTTFGLVAWGVFGNVIDAFFIISAFGLFLPVVLRRGELGSLQTYAIARAARVVPPYWLCIAVILVLISLVPATAQTPFGPPVRFPDAGDILIHLTALQMPARLFGDLPVGFGVDGPLWMISVIVGFYVVFPFVAKAYYRHPFIGLAIAAALMLGWKEAALHLGGFFQMLEGGHASPVSVQLIATDQLPGWAFSFALGMTGAWTYARLHERGPAPEGLDRKATAVAGLAVVAVVICAYLYGREAAEINAAIAGSVARGDPLLTLAYSASRAVLMAAIVLCPLWIQRPFANRPVRRLAELSYGLYLIHFVVAYYVGGVLLGIPRDGSVATVGLWFAVVLPVSLAYAYLSLLSVERPARRWVRRRSRPRAPVAPELAEARAGAGS